jgi:hypothetical protein
MDILHQFRWRPEIGDPSFMGWLTVAAYALTALTAWLASRRAKRSPGTVGGSHFTWTLVSILMAALCLNKQLDLQSLLTDIGRVISYHGGWYADRREFQKWFVLGVLVLSGGTTCVMLVCFHQFWMKHFLLSTGLVLLLTFIAVRAVSFHHFDLLLKSQFAGARMNWIFELGGIGMIWLAAWIDYQKPKRASKAPWKPAK